ncbi:MULTISPECIES: sigma 54-interacting transcriptional regulator [unclassified Mesotoga]|uniref:sigma 54-interacting transcriptional regulator n=1 Tax=unclassified Mesotoga TaxID=1184398 RepID=UPI000C195180|nr:MULTISPECIES: sigma 54-interacting transcriptional regulator [unclassified Mesotoga]PVD16103.1 Fis family transcriptional regulator [Mesotoga sp. Brook.08.105.5.1]RAO96578.1 Fis family transcriptional regulator [Mesotoga sp. Brook.08.YT.4.2.5.4.]
MLYRKIMVGENLESMQCEMYFESLFDVDFDYLVGLGKDMPTILFIDASKYSKDVLNDWIFAFTNIILINNNPIRAFIIRGYSEELQEFKGYYRVVSSYKSARQIVQEIVSSIDGSLDKIIGKSNRVLQMKKMMVLTMFYDGSIMILGETGSGKNLLAEVIAKLSPRGSRPFYSINCAAIPENLLESELFGYKKGAFTGATSEKVGLIEQANYGTLFLDEIGDMPLNLQAKILAITENREFFKIGATKPMKVDVRFITATNRYDDSALRNDLRYRLSAVKIDLPPLRERKTDIPLIFDDVLEKKGYLVKFDNIPKELKERFLTYNYPGNVRELINMVEEYLAVNDVVQASVNSSMSKNVKLLAEEAMVARIVNGTTYKDFLQEVYKSASQELLQQRSEVLGNDINELSKEFGLTTRRIRDLLAELNSSANNPTRSDGEE